MLKHRQDFGVLLELEGVEEIDEQRHLLRQLNLRLRDHEPRREFAGRAWSRHIFADRT